jgi:hypothetical protein
MWIGLVVIVIAAVGLVGGVFAGGIFTIVLIPLAVIAAIWALISLGAARGLGLDAALKSNDPSRNPGRPEDLPSDPRPGHVATTPEGYLKARQQSQ